MPKVAQDAGTACRCVRGSVPLGHVALSRHTRLLVRLRPCGPSSTISERRSRSKMARADTCYMPGVRKPVVRLTGSRTTPSLRPQASTSCPHRARSGHHPPFKCVAFRLARVLALHVLALCAYSATACAYLAFICVFASLLVCADTACLRQRVMLVRAPSAQIPCTGLRVPSLCLLVYFVCTWSTSSIAATTIRGGLPPSIMGAPRRQLRLARGSIYSG